jgi:DNA (cytosine-5)-methyltransferase 1
MTFAYYNENDTFAAAWLRELITDGQIMDGVVDERDIQDVQPADLVGFTRCHFFAGIGGWDYALRLAGWFDDVPVWTGSCPCQPFSTAGQRGGTDDPRHLWPTWFRLIRECRPPVVFGEQVESAIGHGWLDLVFDDLEGEGYACGAAVLPACSVGAPHLRQRLWFVADAASNRTWDDAPERVWRTTAIAEAHGTTGRVADHDGAGCDRERFEPAENSDTSSGRDINGSGVVGGARDAGPAQPSQLWRHESDTGSAWSSGVWLKCRDGKARFIEPSICPLAHGIPNRVGTLRGVGNAIVSPVAAEVIGAYMDARKERRR